MQNYNPPPPALILPRIRSEHDNPEANKRFEDKQDRSKWNGRLMSQLAKGNNEADSMQRAMGYKVYEDDKGKDPFYIDPYTRTKIQFRRLSYVNLFDVFKCTIL